MTREMRGMWFLTLAGALAIFAGICSVSLVSAMSAIGTGLLFLIGAQVKVKRLRDPLLLGLSIATLIAFGLADGASFWVWIAVSAVIFVHAVDQSFAPKRT